ncbi:hypothetical protein CBW24_01970 [Pacificitalea manganoxidans]|uniref:Uncharacterized protein n=1 Tax=Pacificitalea manganoxidans TaxID=1411902 RepID=A0A291LW10_9RHOB|nr:hypothetical protein [Pacificitalea manganoxidans]ATI40890.1 hypothetical protein CBW24_01970 [Pacificitalea manganoxidans]MDR6308223.1 hypothetical protein [Pacificitalea manganoxidans]
MHAAFSPVPEETLVQSNARYEGLDGLATLARHWQNIVVPLRVLGDAGVTLVATTISDRWWSANPSVVFNEVCRFRSIVLDASVAECPTDLLVLMDEWLPDPRDWAENGIAKRDLCADAHEGAHSLARYAYALLEQRLDTPTADFLAFQEAATALSNVGLFEAHGEGCRLSDVACLLFPSLQSRAEQLLQRRRDLAWREEDWNGPWVVPAELLATVGGAS